MGISINSIGGLSGITPATDGKLTAATKAALEALGIDTSSIITEAQGQAALKSAKTKTEQPQKTQATNKNSSMAEIKDEAKQLAAKIGVSVSDNDKIDEILTKISAKIESLKSAAGGDKTKTSEIDGYQAQLESITNSLNSTKSAQSQLSASMNNMAMMNKILLNLP